MKKVLLFALISIILFSCTTIRQYNAKVKVKNNWTGNTVIYKGYYLDELGGKIIKTVIPDPLSLAPGQTGEFEVFWAGEVKTINVTVSWGISSVYESGNVTVSSNFKTVQEGGEITFQINDANTFTVN